MIEFKKVGLRLGGQEILRGVDLQIQGGEMIAIVGASGAGKSSLLKILTGEYTPTQGEMKVDGVQIASLGAKYLQLYRRKLGVVFQDFKLLPKKTVYENVAFALEVCEQSEEQIKKRAPEVLDLVGLRDKEKQFPQALSGGEQQRVAFARALANQPALFIADEPTGNLDKQNAREIMSILQKINAQGTTVILTTHQLELLPRVSMLKVLTLDKGQLQNCK